MKLILDMGGEVRKMVLATKQSFRSDDANRHSDAKAADKVINALDHKIEEEATLVLALMNPLAVDLRFVISVLKITTMLERAGDLAKNTIKRTVKMGAIGPEPAVQKLEKMTDIVLEMLDTALSAFELTDTAKATEVWKRDDEIDKLYKEIFAATQKDMASAPETVNSSVHVLFAAKNIERLADYVTSLAKTVYYVNSGKRADKTVLKADATDDAAVH